MPVSVDRYVDQLHRYFAAGSLRILVGAGVSRAAGFPGWDQLNLALLERSLADSRAHDPSNRRLAQEICGALGRDAAADFVWSSQDRAGAGAFFEMFAEVLYGGRQASDLLLPTVALQLAAMSTQARTYTTNYDPLLELARLRLEDPRVAAGDAAWRRFRHGIGRAGPGLIRHIHGWVDPDGTWGGTFVLTESQYIELQNAPGAAPNRDVSEILDGEGAVLIVGMSLADQNLRRILYRRSLSPFAAAPTYAVIKASSREADQYQDAHWRTRKIALIYLSDYSELAPMLRNIQFGQAPPRQAPAWLESAGRWLEEQGEDPFSDRWQQRSWRALRRLRAHLQRRWPRRGERVQLSLFRLAADGGALVKVADSKVDRARTGAEARRHARARRLSVRVGQEQGVAGMAFASGQAAHATNRQGLNLRFTTSMRQAWERDFRSLVAVPIFGGAHERWLPVGVTVATSTHRRPLWTDRRGEERQPAMDLLVELGKSLLLGKLADP